MSATFTTIAKLLADIVKTFVKLQRFGQHKKAYGDEVYCRSQVALLLLWREYHDATKEGDGVRVVAIPLADIQNDEPY